MKRDERGALNILLIPFILLIVLFIGAVSFAVWAYLGRQEWKNNAQPKIDAAVAVAKAETSSQKDNEFVEKEKQPLETYQGPADFGSVNMQYPKTWSGYVAAATGTSGTLIDGYFQPGIVPNVQDRTKSYALRVQVTDKSYTSTLRDLQSKQKEGKVQVASYALPKVPDVVGVYVTGEINTDKSGTKVILPLRDKTLTLWTDGSDFTKDFNDIILANFTFSP